MNGQAKISVPRGSIDGRSLEIKLRTADRRRKLNAFLLVAPLFIFILVIFVMPILSLM